MDMTKKVQMINEMIEQRKKVVATLDELGMYEPFAHDSSFLIHDENEFFSLAKYLNVNVESGNLLEDGELVVKFYYKNVRFHTFVNINLSKYQRYKSEIDKDVSGKS